MPIIRKSCIEEIKARVNILDVVSHTVTLRKAGASFKGLSPFNQEKTPSFFVSPDRGMYKCFSSGKAGDIFSFVMETERLSFQEAVETIAGRFNIEIVYEEGNARAAQQRSLRQELLLIHETAVDFFHQAFLADDADAASVREYWMANRGFPMEVADEHKIGLSPVNQRELTAECRRKGISFEALKECGLFYQRGSRADEASLLPRFRGRLMIPIRDHQGRPIAFTARQLDLTPADDPSRDAKYINSPETPLFSKSHVLFGLERARMAAGEDKPFLLVEGQLDTIRCWQHGLDTAVAPQGTAVTEGQLMMLRRYAPGIDCLLDGDRAGQKAALRFLPIALKTGLDTRFFVLPPGEDPDTLLRRGGVEAWRAVAAKPVSAIAYAAGALLPDVAAATPEQKARASRSMFELISHSDSEIARSEYIREAAEAMKLDWAGFSGDFTRYLHQRLRRAPVVPVEKETGETRSPKLTTAEETLLHICLHDPKLGREITAVIDPEWIDREDRRGRLLNRILAEMEHGLWEGVTTFLDDVEDAEERNMIHSLAFSPPAHEDSSQVANEAIRQLHKTSLLTKIREIDLELANAKDTIDRAIFLQRKRNEYRRLLLDPPRISARGF